MGNRLFGKSDNQPQHNGGQQDIVMQDREGLREEMKQIVKHGEYEHQHRYVHLINGINIEQICKNAPDNDFAKGLRENYAQLLADNAFKLNYLYSSHPATDKSLSPAEIYVGYKVARFMVNGRLSPNVAVLLTLYISSTKTHIVRGATGELVQPSMYGLDSNMEYGTGSAIVAGVQFIGNIQSVTAAYFAYISGEGRIVSNFDPRFEYKLGYEVIEPEMGKKGLGCVKCIHFYSGKNSAIKYTNRGFLGSLIVTPVISGVVSNGREVDDPDIIMSIRPSAPPLAILPAQSSAPLSTQPSAPSSSENINKRREPDNKDALDMLDVNMQDMNMLEGGDVSYEIVDNERVMKRVRFDEPNLGNIGEEKKEEIRSISFVTKCSNEMSIERYLSSLIVDSDQDMNKFAERLFGSWYVQHNLSIPEAGEV